MAINKNHEFEELDGIKCAIVEKNVSKDRVVFLKDLLEYNGFIVVVIPTPPPKPAPVAAPKPATSTEISTAPPAAAEGLTQAQQTSNIEPQTSPKESGVLRTNIDPPAPAPETFTVGVTNVSFNPTNAIFGRLLRTRNGHVVTMHYWEQKETESHDEIPYFDQKP